MSESGYYRSVERGVRLPACPGYEACPAGEHAYNIDGYSMAESLLPGMPVPVWSWRALTACISDLAAVGAAPVAAGYSIGVSSVEQAWQAWYGFTMASRYYGVETLKSDTNRSARGGEWIDVYCTGRLAGSPAPNTPPPGRYTVIQAGYAGYGALERRLLEKRGGVPATLRLLEKRKISPDLWRLTGECGVAAAVDNSDGYLYTLETLARRGRITIILEEPPLLDPRLEGIIEAGEALGSWEDYNLFILASGESVECVLGEASRHGIPARIIGKTAPSRRGGLVRLLFEKF
ncbi:MAG: AIR synthase related protein [Desulfurococcales archaeon]|nr:AIR synthase related protein [Desulfurococcales archaeon]